MGAGSGDLFCLLGMDIDWHGLKSAHPITKAAAALGLAMTGMLSNSSRSLGLGKWMLEFTSPAPEVSGT